MVNASITCSNCTTVTLNRITPYDKSVVLTANVTGCAGNYSATHLVHLGKPFYTATGCEVDGSSHPIKVWTGSSFDYNEICIDHTATTQFTFSGAQSVNWTRTYASQSSTTWGTTGDNIYLYFFGTSQYSRYALNASNVCGSLIGAYGFSSKVCDTGGGGTCDVYQLSPNPATSSIQVMVTPNIPAPCDPPPPTELTITDQKISTLSKVNSTSSRSIEGISIYNDKGVLQQQLNYGKGKKNARLNVSNLPNGIYFIQIKDGAYSESHRVVIGK